MTTNTKVLPRGVTGWVYNHARSNYWRLASWYELDDLIQDGLMIAYKCVAKYGFPGEDLDEPHFMRLVQIAFFNHIAQLLRVSRAVDEQTKLADLSTVNSETDALERLAEAEYVSEQDYAVLIDELPAHLRRVVMLFMSDEGAKAVRRPLRKRHKNDETMSDRLAKLAGFPSYLDFETELRAYLWEREAGIA